LQLVEPNFFNQMTTMHGLVMVFGAVMPAFVGLANWLVPMMIGAPDMALPRMNNWSFWILPFAFALLTSTLFMDAGAPNFGWTFYAPLSTTYAPSTVTFLSTQPRSLLTSSSVKSRTRVFGLMSRSAHMR
jgi:cytochrome c oxidase subunit 1